MKIGFIGCGNMGGALAAAAAKSIGGACVLTADHHSENVSHLQEAFGTVPSSARQIAAQCRAIFLGVKPQVMSRAAAEIADVLAAREDHFVLVSMAAGLSAASVAEMFGGACVIRIMPNTPAAVGQGVILYSFGEGVTAEDEELLFDALDDAGLLLPLGEEKIDAASAVSGCGPAFVCMMMEAMADGAVRCGLPRATAEQLAAQTVLGTAALAQSSGKNPSRLRAEVCSPAGSTIEGVAALEARAFRAAVMEAGTAAYRRTREMR